MKNISRIILSLLFSQMLISSAFAICIFGFGSCEEQDIINTATNQLKVGDVTSNTSTVIGDTQVTQGDVQIGETKISADVIKQFIGSQDSTTLFIPLTAAATKQTESTEKIFKELKEVIKDINKSNQELLVKQAEEQRKFTEALVKQVIASPPTIPIVSGSSSFPISLPTNSLSTPIYVKYIDPITINNNNMSFPASNSNSDAVAKSITQTAHGFSVGNWVYLNGTTYTLTDADVEASAESVGVVKTVTDTNTFTLVTDGYISGLTGLTAGAIYYLSGTAGTITSTAPSANVKAVLIADSTTSGYVQQYALGDSATTLERYSITRLASTSGQQSVTSTTAAAMNLSSSTLNINTGGFTPTLASGQIVVTNAGDYAINLTTYGNDSGGTASALITRFLVGGVEKVKAASTAASTYDFMNSITTVQTLAAGAVITFTVASSDGETLTIEGYDMSIVQQPKAVTSAMDGTVTVDDQAASGYFDIGTMRMQWGTHNDGNVDTTTVTLPAAFANTSYSVVATSNTAAGSLAAESKTTTTFDIDRASTTTTTQTYSWQAFGLKP